MKERSSSPSGKERSSSLLGKVSTVIVAGGKGERFGWKKQFADIYGYPLIYYTILPFNELEEVGDIILVLPEGDTERGMKLKNYFSKLSCVVPGGKERTESVEKGLEFAQGEFTLIHDGSRPCITHSLILRILDKLGQYPVVVPVLKVVDTTFRAMDGKIESLDRENLLIVQTPQGFKTELLREAFRKRRSDKFYTDEASLLKDTLGIEPYFVEGERGNIKVTFREDLQFIKGIFLSNMRVGFGYDIHRLEKGRTLFIGGVKIDSEVGAVGHSDGDCLIHSVIDALLGGTALGDIGIHFPDTDPQYSGISSLELLEKARDILKKGGWVVLSIDATVILERPKIAVYIEEMKRRISKVLSIKEELISVKAKTGEKIGAIGEGVAISAYALCQVSRLIHNKY